MPPTGGPEVTPPFVTEDRVQSETPVTRSARAPPAPPLGEAAGYDSVVSQLSQRPAMTGAAAPASA